MVKHTQSVHRPVADELFECVWPFYEIGGTRVKIQCSEDLPLLFYDNNVFDMSIRGEIKILLCYFGWFVTFIALLEKETIYKKMSVLTHNYCNYYCFDFKGSMFQLKLKKLSKLKYLQQIEMVRLKGHVTTF